jgi:hypothetical protein
MPRVTTWLLAAIALVSAPTAWAADDFSDDGLEGLEMDVQDADSSPADASSKIIALPAQASEAAQDHAQKGLDRANAAREDGAELGEETSEAARERDGDRSNNGSDGEGNHGRPEGAGKPDNAGAPEDKP